MSAEDLITYPFHPIIGEHITVSDTKKFLLNVSVKIQASVIPMTPAGPWQIADNPALHDCISVPAKDGSGLMQIGKGIHPMVLRPLLAADPANLTEIADMMEEAATVDLPTSFLQRLLNVAVVWNQSMTLKAPELWSSNGVNAADNSEATSEVTGAARQEPTGGAHAARPDTPTYSEPARRPEPDSRPAADVPAAETAAADDAVDEDTTEDSAAASYESTETGRQQQVTAAAASMPRGGSGSSADGDELGGW